MDKNFNSYKAKYIMMNDLLNPLFKSRKLDSLNIFINLDDIYHKMHRPMISKDFQLSGQHAGKQVISNVLNIAAHYRQWAVRKGLDTRVILFYTTAYTGSFKNSIYVKNYRKKFVDINNEVSADYYFINQAIHDADALLKVVTQYIDKVYVIDSRFLEPSIIPYYFSTNVFTPSWNIIISRDQYDLQYSYMDTWSYIYPKGDSTALIDKSNLWSFIAEKEKVSNCNNIYDPALYTTAVCVVGDKYRNIPRIKRIGWGTLFKILNQISEYGDTKSKTSMQILLQNELVTSRTSSQDLAENLNAIDIVSQTERMGEIEKADISSQILDIPDYENLQELNKLHFSKYPINIQFLTEQRQSKYITKNIFGL